MKDSGLSSIDKERIKIINNINKLLFETSNNSLSDYTEKIREAKKELFDFRMKLGTNKATESLEANFRWTDTFDDLNEKLISKIE